MEDRVGCMHCGSRDFSGTRPRHRENWNLHAGCFAAWVLRQPSTGATAHDGAATAADDAEALRLANAVLAEMERLRTDLASAVARLREANDHHREHHEHEAGLIRAERSRLKRMCDAAIETQGSLPGPEHRHAVHVLTALRDAIGVL